MAVRGQKARNVGVKKTSKITINPVRTKTIHFTSTNKYQQGYSPQTVSRQKNQITQAVKKAVNTVAANKRNSSRSVFAKASGGVSGLISTRKSNTRVSVSATGSVPKNPGRGKVIKSKRRRAR